MKIFVIYDRRAEQWNTPFMSRTRGTALRELAMSVKNAPEDNIMKQYPDDFEVYELGDFNEFEGILSAVPRVAIGTLAQLAVE